MGALEDDLDAGVRKCREHGHDSWTTHADGSLCTPACPIHPQYAAPDKVTEADGAVHRRMRRKGVVSWGDLRTANVERQKLWGTKDPMFAAVELGGEVGEALNVVKKLERERLGMAGSRATVEDLADELGDIVICCDLLAARYGINLERATARKFNKTSRKMGFPVEMIED